ncbi:MAG: MEKHLA domain-containing protein [Planctomycetaceae bacterium]|nr:MEKHLA domain-containing protein [Planctomycetaceae bacterium]
MAPESGLSAPWREPGWIEQSQRILDSYRRWLGVELVPRTGSAADDAAALFAAPFVVVSHGTEADPILNYGNRQALDLWELDVATLLQTPSRLTAEPLHRDERAQLLARTTRDGYVDDYRGIRISRTGRRFQIERAVVWNLVATDGAYAGQAATFTEWKVLA